MTGKTALAMAQLAVGMAVFGSATPVAKLVGDALPPLTGAALRVLVGALILLPFATPHLGALRGLGRRDWLVIGAIALFGMVGFSVLMLLGMSLIPGVVGSIVMSTTPAVTAVAAFVFMAAPMGWRRNLAVLLAVAGVALMHLAGADTLETTLAMVLLGSGLVFAAVCCETAYTLLGKAAMDKLRPLTLTFMAAALSLPLFALLAAFDLGRANWPALGWTDWLAVVWWGGGTLGLGSYLWYSGVSKVRGSTAAGFMGVMPVSALVLSYVLLGEPFRWIHLAGFAIVFVGVLLVSWAHAREADQQRQTEDAG